MAGPPSVTIGNIVSGVLSALKHSSSSDLSRRSPSCCRRGSGTYRRKLVVLNSPESGGNAGGSRRAGAGIVGDVWGGYCSRPQEGTSILLAIPGLPHRSERSRGSRKGSRSISGEVGSSRVHLRNSYQTSEDGSVTPRQPRTSFFGGKGGIHDGKNDDGLL